METAPIKPAFTIQASNEVKCSKCGSERLYKDGLRYLADGQSIQRFRCRDCGYRFSTPKMTKPLQKTSKQNLKSSSSLILTKCSSGVSALLEPSVDRAMSNTSLEEKRAAGATKTATNTPKITLPRDVSQKIVDFMWWMKKQGYSESTIISRVKILKTLAKRGADIFDPESVKAAIARQETWSPGRKELAVEAYSNFLLMTGETWDPPKYKRVKKLPFIPLEKEIDQFIAGCSGTKRLMAFLQLLKETGMRCGEALHLKWTDIDFTSNLVRVTPEKGSSPRALKISNKLSAMLNELPKTSQRIFPVNYDAIRKSFDRQRKRLAKKLQNPRLLQITFHTFRHWKATMEYAKTKDILHVMRLLGHKNINNTLIYTQLVDFKTDEYITKVAGNTDEACQLIEAGFEYVCTSPEKLMIFKKRK